MALLNFYKPRTDNYRPIYYDPKKEEKAARDKERAIKNGTAEPERTLRRGVFREMAEKNKNYRVEQIRKSNTRLVIIVLGMLAILYYLLS
jgi:hypothetical protein